MLGDFLFRAIFKKEEEGGGRLGVKELYFHKLFCDQSFPVRTLQIF